jgi:beta-mannanase
LFGAYVDGGQIVPRETLLGRKIPIHHRFYAWTDNWIDDNLSEDVAAGRTPMATWQPTTGALTDITGGKYDTMAHTYAQAAKAVGKPIFLRWGHEMNGDWYPWGGAKNGNDATAPQKYVAAWKHLHDLFVADGATNVLWIWCPNIGGAPNAAWNQPSAYYPGDAYVDWVAVDGYNWGTSQTWSKWTAFKDILGPVYAAYVAMGKPLMIAETGSVEGGGDKAAWVNDLRANMKTSFPGVKAFVYFDTYDTINKTDWKIDSSQGALAAFIAMGKDAYFNP